MSAAAYPVHADLCDDNVPWDPATGAQQQSDKHQVQVVPLDPHAHQRGTPVHFQAGHDYQIQQRPDLVQLTRRYVEVFGRLR